MTVQNYLCLCAFFLNCVKYVTVHAKLVSSLQPSGIRCLPVCGISPICQFKTQLKTFLFRQTYVDHATSHRLCVLYVYVSMCIYYVHEWCVFVLQNHLGSERAIHYYFSINYSALCARMHKKKGSHIKALHNIKAVSRKSPKNISIVTK